MTEKKRLRALMACGAIFATAILGRAAWVQLRPDPRLETMARRQFDSRVLVQPPRGPILDRNGEPLAVNIESGSLAANPGKIRDRRALALLLARVTDVPYARLFLRLGERKEFVWIKRHMAEAELEKLKKASGGALPEGLWLVKENRRVYPHGELASHLLGDVNVDSEGLEGTELWFNDRLRGKVSSAKAIRDALGRPAFIDSQAINQARKGEPVTLTIDASLQFTVEEELRTSIRKTGARAGSVIVMNAVSGEILALANQPAFNPNDGTSPIDRRRNRALTDGYEPGSTIKPLVLAAALSNGWKLTDTVHGENGSFRVQGRTISEAESHEKFAWINLKKLIQVSSNVGAAKLSMRLGADRVLETLKAFGFSSRTDSGFPGEIPGYLPPRKAWQPLTVANVGFGQGLLVTPMQMTRAYASFLNGGWLVQPTLVKGEELKKEAPRRLLSQRVADQVLEALETVTGEGGTGVKAHLEGYRVAGKTGTAQVVDPATRTYSRSRYISSFIGFPLGVEPRIVIYISIDEPKGVYYASDTAAPLFREVLNAVASRFGLPAKVDARKLAQAPPKHVGPLPRVASLDDLLLHDSLPTRASVPTRAEVQPDPAPKLDWTGVARDGSVIYKMPRLSGLAPREAIRALHGHRFQLELVGNGVVRGQHPDEGKAIAEGEKIRLTLAEP
ncbi:MAG TPA: penicillin-binding transpeptidase domain-containing protein [Bdellovibrionota bacterium]|nr:penicillin-binding transpeptidase domain-containing protein [Bdellovibrionota bacterium]